MAKDPSPRADALRAQREARYGHLQAAVTTINKPSGTDAPFKMEKPARKLIPFAGKHSKGIVPKAPNKKIGRPKGKTK